MIAAEAHLLKAAVSVNQRQRADSDFENSSRYQKILSCKTVDYQGLQARYRRYARCPSTESIPRYLNRLGTKVSIRTNCFKISAPV